MSRRESAGHSKVDHVCQHLEQLIANLGPDRRLPSIRALMVRFEMSQSTVVAALDQLESQGLITRRQGSGVFSARSSVDKPTLVYVDSDSATSPSVFWQTLLGGLCQFEAAAGRRCEIRYSKSSLSGSRSTPLEDQLRDGLGDQLRRKEFAGVYAVCQSDHFLEFAAECETPVVGFACPARYHVIHAHLEAAQAGVAALVRCGSRRIAFYNHSFSPLREVFVAALHANGAQEFLGSENDRVFHRDAWGEDIVRQGFEAAMQLFGAPGADRPDGVLSLDDMFTQGYLMGLNQLGVSVGASVRVASMTNAESFALAGWQDRIVRSEFSVTEIADLMTSAMTSLLAGEEPSRGWEQAMWLRHRFSYDPSADFPVRVAIVRPKVIEYETVSTQT